MKTLDERAQVAFEGYCAMIPEKLAEFGEGPHPKLEGVHLDIWRAVVMALDKQDALDEGKKAARELVWEHPNDKTWTAKGILGEYCIELDSEATEDDPLGFTCGDWINYAGNVKEAQAMCQKHHESILGAKL